MSEEPFEVEGNEEGEGIGGYRGDPWIWYPPKPGSLGYKSPHFDPNAKALNNAKTKRVVNNKTLSLIGNSAAILMLMGAISFTVWRDIYIPLASMWLGSAYGICRFIITEEE